MPDPGQHHVGTQQHAIHSWHKALGLRRLRVPGHVMQHRARPRKADGTCTHSAPTEVYHVSIQQQTHHNRGPSNQPSPKNAVTLRQVTRGRGQPRTPAARGQTGCVLASFSLDHSEGHPGTKSTENCPLTLSNLKKKKKNALTLQKVKQMKMYEKNKNKIKS